MALTKRGVPKARTIKALYRDPKFKGGMCCVCRKRPRNYLHPVYPHMCDICLRSRVAIDDMPIATREVMSAQERIDRAMLESHLKREQPKSVQSLNVSTSTKPMSRDPFYGMSAQERIAASAEAFRRSVKK